MVPEAKTRLAGLRLLVVDDNETNRRILDVYLRAWGMLVQMTGSPREALAWVEAGESFDLGILDMHMPEMDGVETATSIRAREAATGGRPGHGRARTRRLGTLRRVRGGHGAGAVFEFDEAVAALAAAADLGAQLVPGPEHLSQSSQEPTVLERGGRAPPGTPLARTVGTSSFSRTHGGTFRWPGRGSWGIRGLLPAPGLSRPVRNAGPGIGEHLTDPGASAEPGERLEDQRSSTGYVRS